MRALLTPGGACTRSCARTRTAITRQSGSARQAKRRQRGQTTSAGPADEGVHRAHVTATAATLGFASMVLVCWGASADTIVKLGTDDGKPEFVPKEAIVTVGENVTFVNNMGFPHNIIFDETGVPEGIDAEKISRERYFNAPGDKYDITFTMVGEYHYYCEPHQKVGMEGVIIVRQGY